MPLDFHRFDTREHLFGFESNELARLGDIFTTFNHWTGLCIDQYGDLVIGTENQKILIKIIDAYIDQTDLNKDKEKTTSILGFRGFLKYALSKHIELQLFGD